jgi:hypothetical protein
MMTTKGNTTMNNLPIANPPNLMTYLAPFPEPASNHTETRDIFGVCLMMIGFMFTCGCAAYSWGMT